MKKPPSPATERFCRPWMPVSRRQPPMERTAYAKQMYYNPQRLSSPYVKTSGLPRSCHAMSMAARYAASWMERRLSPRSCSRCIASASFRSPSLPERSAKAVRKPTAALWTLPKLLTLMVSPPCFHSTAGSPEGQQRSCGSARKAAGQRQPAIPARSYRAATAAQSQPQQQSPPQKDARLCPSIPSQDSTRPERE